MRNLASLVFTAGLLFLLLVILSQLTLGEPPMRASGDILSQGGAEIGAANLVTSVLLAYRGLDTLGELSILFTAATAAGLVLGHRRKGAARDRAGGFILRAGSDLLAPLLTVVGIYIVVHGHLTPGGGFQGGVILAASFFLVMLADPSKSLNHTAIVWLEGLAGAAFIAIGLWALFASGDFLKPLLGKGEMGTLFSAGTLPILSTALGIKVGAELAGLMAQLSDAEATDQ